MLNETEQKILRLALDRAAPPGEHEAAAVMLIKKLRERGATVETIFPAKEVKPYESSFTRRDRDDEYVPIITFGKHEGKRINEIPTNYLK